MQTNETDFETHVDDIVKAVGDKLERNVIVSELKRLKIFPGPDTAKSMVVISPETTFFPSSVFGDHLDILSSAARRRC